MNNNKKKKKNMKKVLFTICFISVLASCVGKKETMESSSNDTTQTTDTISKTSPVKDTTCVASDTTKKTK